jgi:hypothetical protein
MGTVLHHLIYYKIMGSFEKFPPQNKIEEAFDPTFGIDGVWVKSGDPKGTVRVGETSGIQIPEDYSEDNLEELLRSAEVLCEENDDQLTTRYRDNLVNVYAPIIRKLFDQRKKHKEEAKDKIA